MNRILDDNTKNYLKTFRHVIFYAKDHYEKKDTIQDLRRILSQRNGIYEEDISASLIMEALVRIVYPFIKNSEYQFIDFMTSISPNSPENMWRCKSLNFEYSFEHAVIKKCLSILRFTQVINNEGEQIIDLGRHDPEILPISNHSKNKKVVRA